jgi:hypothetical protein
MNYEMIAIATTILKNVVTIFVMLSEWAKKSSYKKEAIDSDQSTASNDAK